MWKNTGLGMKEKCVLYPNVSHGLLHYMLDPSISQFYNSPKYRQSYSHTIPLGGDTKGKAIFKQVILVF